MSQRFFYLILVLLAMLGCTSGSTVDDGSSELTLGQSEVSGQTDGNGDATFSVQVSPGTSAFQLVAFSGLSVLNPTSLRDPAGVEQLSNSSGQTTQARANELNPSTVNFPFVSGSVTAGLQRASYHLASAEAGRDLRLVLLTKSDSQPRNGTLRVNFISVGPVADSEELRSDLEATVETVKVLYSGAGISLDPLWYDFAGDQELPDPRDGAALYSTISAAVRPYAVNVVFAAKVRGLSGDFRYGAAGASPGPAVPSPRSAVVIDLLEITGDGRFQDNTGGSRDRDSDASNFSDERRQAAEEIARGIGHYLGLEDSVTFRGNQVTSTDSLSDTESCLTEEQCRQDSQARSNVMMPRPLRKDRDDQTSFEANQHYSRETFSELQRTVLNNSVFVD